MGTNVLVYIAVVVVVLILVCWLISLICSALRAPGPLGLILQILAVIAAIVMICRKMGWV